VSTVKVVPRLDADEAGLIGAVELLEQNGGQLRAGRQVDSACSSRSMPSSNWAIEATTELVPSAQRYERRQTAIVR